jgi:hypothetical protein
MAERIFGIEYQPGEEVVLRFKVPALSIMPEATKGHFRMAHKEMLLALRSLLDRAIERAEEAEKTKAKKRTKIEVQ